MNYFGSKSRQAKYIVPIIQKYIDDNGISIYLEPFVGGANIIDKINCDIKIGTDINKYTIVLFNYIQNGGQLKDFYTKDIYMIKLVKLGTIIIKIKNSKIGK